jgi:hypothetical protein
VPIRIDLIDDSTTTTTTTTTTRETVTTSSVTMDGLVDGSADGLTDGPIDARVNSAHGYGAGGATVREVCVFRKRGVSLRESIHRASRGGDHLHARAIVGRERGDEDEG